MTNTLNDSAAGADKVNHNNHHAFPASARHGLYPGQIDIGFAFVRLLERLGLASDVQTPDTLPRRAGITAATADAEAIFDRPGAAKASAP
jgi:hypothetical protein